MITNHMEIIMTDLLQRSKYGHKEKDIIWEYLEIIGAVPFGAGILLNINPIPISPADKGLPALVHKWTMDRKDPNKTRTSFEEVPATQTY